LRISSWEIDITVFPELGDGLRGHRNKQKYAKGGAQP